LGEVIQLLLHPVIPQYIFLLKHPDQLMISFSEVVAVQRQIITSEISFPRLQKTPLFKQLDIGSCSGPHRVSNNQPSQISGVQSYTSLLLPILIFLRASSGPNTMRASLSFTKKLPVGINVGPFGVISLIASTCTPKRLIRSSSLSDFPTNSFGGASS